MFNTENQKQTLIFIMDLSFIKIPLKWAAKLTVHRQHHNDIHRGCLLHRLPVQKLRQILNFCQVCNSDDLLLQFVNSVNCHGSTEEREIS